MTPIVHATFRIERTYPKPPRRVFAAFADPVTKRRWFTGDDGWEVDGFTSDFRPGGLETTRFRREGSDVPLGNETIYLDIVDDARIVFAYAMTVGAERISASLATVELAATDGGTALVYTEQGAYFDRPDAPIDRETGCRELFERLAEFL